MSNDSQKKKAAIESGDDRKEVLSTEENFNVIDGKKTDEAFEIRPAEEERRIKADEILKAIEKAAQQDIDCLELLKGIVSSFKTESEVKARAPHICEQEAFKGRFKKTDVIRVWKEQQQAQAEEEFKKVILPFAVEVEPYSDDVNGADLLKEIVGVLRKHIVFKDADTQAYTCALWVLATWCIDSFKYSPYLMITAPEKGCGKSQLLGLLANISYRSVETGNISTAAFFRMMEEHKPTLFIDEADSFLASDPDLQGVIKCGIERGKAFVYRMDKDKTGKLRLAGFNCFGMKAISGISANNISGPITDRSLTIELQRKLITEVTPRVRDTPDKYWEELKAKCKAFALEAESWLKDRRPDLPIAIGNREADKWEPLILIADYLDEHFPCEEAPDYYGQRARQCAVKLAKTDQDLPVKIELLSDIRDLLNGDLKNDFKDYVLSADIVNALNRNEELRWSIYNHGNGITQRQLAQHLKAFGIHGKQVRTENNKRGYTREDFKEPFKHYLEELID